MQKLFSACSFISIQIKVIFIRMVSHFDSLWNRGTRELGNGLFQIYLFFQCKNTIMAYSGTPLVLWARFLRLTRWKQSTDPHACPWIGSWTSAETQFQSTFYPSLSRVDRRKVKNIKQRRKRQSILVPVIYMPHVLVCLFTLSKLIIQSVICQPDAWSIVH